MVPGHLTWNGSLLMSRDQMMVLEAWLIYFSFQNHFVSTNLGRWEWMTHQVRTKTPAEGIGISPLANRQRHHVILEGHVTGYEVKMLNFCQKCHGVFVFEPWDKTKLVVFEVFHWLKANNVLKIFSGNVCHGNFLFEISTSSPQYMLPPNKGDPPLGHIWGCQIWLSGENFIMFFN